MRRWMTYLALCLALLLAGGSQAAAADDSCPSAGWRSSPLAKPVASADFEPTQSKYYTEEVMPVAGPSITGLVITVVTILVFLLWRFVRCCCAQCCTTCWSALCCCCCDRSHRSSSPVARRLTVCKALASAALVGVIVGAALGMSRVNPHLVPEAAAALDTVKVFLGSVATQMSTTVVHVADLQAAVTNLEVATGQPAPVDVAGITSQLPSMRDQFADLEQQLADIHSDITASDGTVGKYDKRRQQVMYAFLALSLGLAVLLWLAVLTAWPAPTKALTAILLLLLIIIWLLVLVMSALLKVGSDGCANAEDQIVDRVTDGESMKTALRYYLQPTTPTTPTQQVLLDAFAVDVASIVASILQVQTDMEQFAQSFPAFADLASAVGAAAAVVAQDVGIGIVNAVGYSQVHPVYSSVKGYGCCTLLNFVGSLWCALIVLGVFGVLLCFCALAAIAAMDSLPNTGCCRRFRQSDLSQAELEELPTEEYSAPASPTKGAAHHALPVKQQQQFMVAADATEPSIPAYGAAPPSAPYYHVPQSQQMPLPY